jgi:hypothetical protein
MGGYLVVDQNTGRDVLVQVDYDFPSLAESFGWSGKLLPKSKTRYVNIDDSDITGAQIYSSIVWLDSHEGKLVEDPGYFSQDDEAHDFLRHVLDIYDNGGKTADRYSIFVEDQIGEDMCLGLSDDCNMPNGVNSWFSGVRGRHNGKKISFADLPKRVQDCARMRLGHF